MDTNSLRHACNTADKVEQFNDQDSPLLRLPAELRNHIYNYACGGLVISVVYSSKAGVRNYLLAHESCITSTSREFRHICLIMFVCRKLYKETRLLPFSLNEFYITATRVFFLGFYLRDVFRRAVTVFRVDYNTIQYIKGAITCIPEHFALFEGLKRVIVQGCPRRPLTSDMQQQHYLRGVEKAFGDLDVEVEYEFIAE